MKIFILHLSWMLAFSPIADSHFKTDPFLEKIFSSDQDSILQKLIHQPDKFRVQIIYTKIDRDADNHPGFKNYYLHVGKDFYFYPASTVKLPLALLSLEKINRLHKPGVDKFTRILYDSSYSGQKELINDSSSETGYPSVAQFIRKA